jgi:hypothetical protein
MEMSNELHESAALPPVKDPRVTTGLEGDWARAERGAVEKTKISCPCQESNTVIFSTFCFVVLEKTDWKEEN